MKVKSSSLWPLINLISPNTLEDLGEQMEHVFKFGPKPAPTCLIMSYIYMHVTALAMGPVLYSLLGWLIQTAAHHYALTE